MRKDNSTKSLLVLSLAMLATISRGGDWNIPVDAPLLTRWAKEVSPANALPEYPRPQMVRKEWLNLNGLWDYAITDKNRTSTSATYDGQILVPFCIESALSGVMKPFLPTQRLWYHRRFTIPASWDGQRVLLHFGAVDWETRVMLNGTNLGSHRGGYDAFSFDVTDALKPGKNDLVVEVDDPTDSSWQLHGKQKLHPGFAFMTAVSGIWQTVWLEPVADSYVDALRMVTDVNAGVLHLTINGRISPSPKKVVATVFDGTTPVATVTGTLGGELTSTVIANLAKFYKATSELATTTIDLPIPRAKSWSPDSPFLYNLNVTIEDADGKPIDRVNSYFGMRTLTKGKDAKGHERVYLNDKMLLLPGVLDQGYWPDGLYTAATDGALEFDLQAAKRLGVTIRKHVKIEPDRWYYWADVIGVLVMQDMPSGSEGDAHTDMPTSPEAADESQAEFNSLITQRWNHPSIICWVMFNEGWGQYNTLAFAKWAKELDPTRLIDEASGFPWHGGGDVADHHGGSAPSDGERIGITSEDGGWGLSSPGHDWQPQDKDETYRTYDSTTGGTRESLNRPGTMPAVDAVTKAWFTKKVVDLFQNLYRQSDEIGQTGDFVNNFVDQEIDCDGLFSYDRAVWKVDPDRVRAAARGEIGSANRIIR